MPVPNELRIPLLVDVGVVFTMIFGGGIMWQKVDALTHEIAAIREQLTADRDNRDVGRTSTVDRLARLETRMEIVIDKLDRIEEQGRVRR